MEARLEAQMLDSLQELGLWQLLSITLCNQQSFNSVPLKLNMRRWYSLCFSLRDYRNL